jgi:hypothetical protein
VKARLFLVAALFVMLCGLAAQPRSGLAAQPSRIRSHGCIFDHLMLRTPSGLCRPEAKRYPHRVVGPIRRAIYDSALTFGIPYHILLRIAFCESSLNPYAVNGSHYGLFQFLPATFVTGLRAMWRETGIVAWSYWSPLDASYVAGYLFASGHARRWSCEPHYP